MSCLKVIILCFPIPLLFLWAFEARWLWEWDGRQSDAYLWLVRPGPCLAHNRSSHHCKPFEKFEIFFDWSNPSTLLCHISVSGSEAVSLFSFHSGRGGHWTSLKGYANFSVLDILAQIPFNPGTLFPILEDMHLAWLKPGVLLALSSEILTEWQSVIDDNNHVERDPARSKDSKVPDMEVSNTTHLAKQYN